MEKGFCFVCGANNNVGLKLNFKLDRKKRQAICSTVISGEYQGWDGIVHGGIIASMLDGSMVYACKSIDFSCFTAELTVRYIKPVPLNKQVKIIAAVKDQVQWMSYILIYTEAIMKMDGIIAAKAKAKMLVKQEVKLKEKL
jgi:acyl-coenzyme A thioesterase PaaI-like protein